jgi:hypothetical protein
MAAAEWVEQAASRRDAAREPCSSSTGQSRSREGVNARTRQYALQTGRCSGFAFKLERKPP